MDQNNIAEEKKHPEKIKIPSKGNLPYEGETRKFIYGKVRKKYLFEADDNLNTFLGLGGLK